LRLSPGVGGCETSWPPGVGWPSALTWISLADLVAGFEPFVGGFLQLFFGDLADAAEQMGGAAFVRVVADEDALDGDPGKAALILFQVVDEVIADVLAQRHRGPGGDFFLFFDRPPQLAQRHLGEVPELLQLGHFFDCVFGQFLGVQLQRQAGAVVDQDVAGAVEDVATRSDHLVLAGAVVLGLGQILAAGQHLQVPEPEEEHGEEGDGDAAEHSDPQRHAGAGSGTVVRTLVHVAPMLPAPWAAGGAEPPAPRPGPGAGSVAGRCRSASRARRRRCP
jgi:hypothetical protein